MRRRRAVKRRPRLVGGVSLALGVCALLFLGIELHNGRFHQTDFRSYYQAAGRVSAGVSPYGVTDSVATVPFLYPPPVAYVFVPFRLLPIGTACIVWYLLNTAALLILMILLRSLFGAPSGMLQLAFVLAVAQPLQRELHVGNVNLVLTCLGLGAIALAGRSVLCLVPFALIKPQNVVGVLPIALSSVRRLWPFVLALVVLALSPLLTFRPTALVHLYRDFLDSLLSYDARFGGSFKYAATLAGLVSHCLQALHRSLPEYAPAIIYCIIAVGVVAYVRRAGMTPRALTVSLACVPLATPGDSQTFLLSAPLMYALLCERRTAPGWLLLAGAMILFGGNWHDLIGRSLSVQYDSLGMRGIATIGLVALAVLERTFPRDLASGNRTAAEAERAR